LILLLKVLSKTLISIRDRLDRKIKLKCCFFAFNCG
jgi:hypothetical protein